VTFFKLKLKKIYQTITYFVFLFIFLNHKDLGMLKCRVKLYAESKNSFALSPMKFFNISAKIRDEKKNLIAYFFMKNSKWMRELSHKLKNILLN